MAQLMYSNENLLALAQENYDKLTRVCKTLDAEGYWEQPRQVLKHTIQDFLDLYVQAALIKLAVYCGRFREDERSFILELPKNNVIGCTQKEDDEELLFAVKKLMKNPPILLQLCGVRDVDKDSDFTEQFFDSFLNILLCMSRLNNAKNHLTNAFIQEYYNQIVVFIKREGAQNGISPRYIFRKLSTDRLDLELEHFIEKTEMVAADASDKLEAAKKRQRLQGRRQRAVRQEKPAKPKLSEEYSAVYDSGEDEREYPADSGGYEEDQSREEDIQESFEDTEEEKQEESLESGSHQDQVKHSEDFLAAKGQLEHQMGMFAVQKIREITKVERKKTKLEEYLEELNQLVGLQEVKTEINSLINLIKIRKMRESYQMPVTEMTYHMVFTGNPGTGKTTVARLVSKIYQELGILSKGNLVETDRSGLVAGYVGQTALKVRETVERALGGVLFIDEAYSLTNQAANDFGGEAIDALVKLMEDYRDNLVVIVAGYTDEMKQFLESNPGLVSRFNKFIEFKDYSEEELLDILASMAKQAGITVQKEALSYIGEQLRSMESEAFRQFGNARGIRNLFEKMLMNQANRLVSAGEMSREALSQLCLEDASLK